MFTLSNLSDLERHITGQNFTVVRLETMDENLIGMLEGENPGQLFGTLADWLKHYRGTYIFKLKRHKTDPQPFILKWAPDQLQGTVLNGTAADPAAIKAQIMAELKAEQERNQEREELERLRSINGQIVTALGGLLNGIVPQLLQRFGMAPATLQGVDIETMTAADHDTARAALDQLLQFATPEFLQHLAGYVSNNPQVITMISQLTGYTGKATPHE